MPLSTGDILAVAGLLVAVVGLLVSVFLCCWTVIWNFIKRRREERRDAGVTPLGQL